MGCVKERNVELTVKVIIYRVIHIRRRACPGKNATQKAIHKAISIPITLSGIIKMCIKHR
jgi:hypothetical protein